MTDSTHNTKELQDFFFKLVEARPHIAERIQNNLLTSNELGWASKEDSAYIHKAARQATTEALLNPRINMEKKPFHAQAAGILEAVIKHMHQHPSIPQARRDEWIRLSTDSENLLRRIHHAIAHHPERLATLASTHNTPLRRLCSTIVYLQSMALDTPVADILRQLADDLHV